MAARKLKCDVGPASAGKAAVQTIKYGVAVLASSRLKPVPRRHAPFDGEHRIFHRKPSREADMRSSMEAGWMKQKGFEAHKKWSGWRESNPYWAFEA